MNGYFQLVNGDKGTEIRLIPPVGGENIRINEVKEYLAGLSISYDLPALNKVIANLTDVETTFLLNSEKSSAKQESFAIYLSTDKMEAVARFYPPSSDGELMTLDEIKTDLQMKGIVYGVDEGAIEKYVQNREYCKDIVIAKGKPVRHGTDARIEYYFNTDLKARPTLKEDGSVDFFNLNIINHCNAGDVLAKLILEDPGDYGKAVTGEAVRPRDVKKQRLQFGNNITRSEDKTILTSNVNGHVSLVDNKVFVSNVLEVENVDMETGNIEYDGNVQINGNVCSNFTIKAKGNVEVKGVVEGAYIEAGGDIVIARGMNGMSKGKLIAGGNVIAKFIENAMVSAEGYVESGSILHSKIMARTEINVDSKKGFITGGNVCATNKVNVKTLGSPMGADTIVEVGVNPSIKRRYQEVQKQLVDANKTLKSIEPILRNSMQKIMTGGLTTEQTAYMATLSDACEQKKAEIKACTKEIEDLQSVMEASVNAQVIVRGEVYPGTRIIISDATMVVKKTLKYCKFVKMSGDVKMTGI